MRPLARPPWEARFEGEDAALVAQHAFGPFCAACERHLPEGAVAWNADTGQIPGRSATAGEWPGLLPLCPNCAAAAIGSPLGAAAGVATLRPDRDATFALEATSALAYELRPLAVGGGGDDADAVAERVMVVPRSAAAAATVRRFALNTPFHVDPARDALVLPAETTLSEVEAYDPRLERRTAAWHHAHDAADALLEARPEGRPAVLRMISWAVRFQGFWSVWATVLWRRSQDEAVLDALRRHPDLPATRYV
jgi:hypothetical protein